MAKVFSWKIAPGKYSYLIEENGSFIRSRVTDPQTLYDMANTVESWSEAEYRDAYERMRAEVESKYGTIFDDQNYYEIGEIDSGKVVLLAGEDGGSGNCSGSGSGSGGHNPVLDETDYEKLIEKINEEFERYRNELNEQIAAIRSALEEAVSTDLSDAMNRLESAREELEEIRARMEDAMDKAQSALDAARELKNLSDLDITPEKLLEILSMETNMSEWIEKFDGKIAQLLTDYDRATGDLGGMGIGIDVSRGLFSLMLENINTVNGTVGTINQTWAANSGAMTTMGTWYNESAGTYAEAVRLLDASRAAIEDVVNFYNGSSTSHLKSYIDGEIAEMGNYLSHEGGNGDLTVIEQKLNALSGLVATYISMYDADDGTITNMVDRMNALERTATKALTVANYASGTAKDLRDEWDAEKGTIRSVTDFVIRKDEYGYDIYWYWTSGMSQDEKYRVYYQGEDEDHKQIFTTNPDGSGTRVDSSNVVPDFMSTMMSYIAQNSSAISITVSSGDIVSSLGLTVDDEGSRINMTADKVVIDSDVFAEAIMAKEANIGGIHMGDGIISAGTPDGKHWVLTGDGDLYAENGYFKGTVTASDIIMDGKSLKLWDGSGNPFEIGNNVIDVKHVPETVTLEQQTQSGAIGLGAQGGGTGRCVSIVGFTVTGNTTVYIPKATFRVRADYGGGTPSYPDYTSILGYTISYGLFPGTTSFNGTTLPNNCIEANTQTYNLSEYGNSTLLTGTQHLGLTASETYQLDCVDGASYYVCAILTWTGQTSNMTNEWYITGTIEETSFINAPETSNQQFFNIGRNGMQIFLQGGFYFTAAYNESTGQPIIAMGGKKGSGNGTQMIGLKLDQSGIKVLRGIPGRGWEDI